MAKVKGKCRNFDECSLAGTIQEVEESAFVCEECGKELYPVEGKAHRHRIPRLAILIGVVIIVGGGIAVGVVYGIKAKNKRLQQMEELARMQTVQDSIAQAQADSIAAVQYVQEQARLDSIAKAEAAKKAKKSTGSIDYGKWSGGWKAGKPNGTGTMRYTKERLIDNRDPQKRIAKPGDYVIGEFANGKLVQGRWYDSSNNLKGSIIIGM